jgi:hypothetical protein
MTPASQGGAPATERCKTIVKANAGGALGIKLRPRVDGDLSTIIVGEVDPSGANVGTIQPGDQFLTVGGVNVLGKYESLIRELSKAKAIPDGLACEVLRVPLQQDDRPAPLSAATDKASLRKSMAVAAEAEAAATAALAKAQATAAAAAEAEAAAAAAAAAAGKRLSEVERKVGSPSMEAAGLTQGRLARAKLELEAGGSGKSDGQSSRLDSFRRSLTNRPFQVLQSITSARGKPKSDAKELASMRRSRRSIAMGMGLSQEASAAIIAEEPPLSAAFGMGDLEALTGPGVAAAPAQHQQADNKSEEQRPLMGEHMPRSDGSQQAPLSASPPAASGPYSCRRCFWGCCGGLVASFLALLGAAAIAFAAYIIYNIWLPPTLVLIDGVNKWLDGRSLVEAILDVVHSAKRFLFKTDDWWAHSPPPPPSPPMPPMAPPLHICKLELWSITQVALSTLNTLAASALASAPLSTPLSAPQSTPRSTPQSTLPHTQERSPYEDASSGEIASGEHPFNGRLLEMNEDVQRCTPQLGASVFSGAIAALLLLLLLMLGAFIARKLVDLVADAFSRCRKPTTDRRLSLKLELSMEAAKLRERVNGLRKLLGLRPAPVSLAMDPVTLRPISYAPGLMGFEREPEAAAPLLTEWDLLILFAVGSVLPLADVFTDLWVCLGFFSSQKAGLGLTQVALLVGAGAFNGAVAAHLLPHTRGLALFAERIYRNGSSQGEFDFFATVSRPVCFAVGMTGLSPTVQALHDLYVGLQSRSASELKRWGALSRSAPQLYFQVGAYMQDYASGDGSPPAPVRLLSIFLSFLTIAVGIHGAWTDLHAPPPRHRYAAEANERPTVSVAVFAYAASDAALRACTVGLLSATVGWPAILCVPLAGAILFYSAWELLKGTGEWAGGWRTRSSVELIRPAILQVLAPHMLNEAYSDRFVTFDAVAPSVLALVLALSALLPVMPHPLDDPMMLQAAFSALSAAFVGKFAAFIFIASHVHTRAASGKEAPNGIRPPDAAMRRGNERNAFNRPRQSLRKFKRVPQTLSGNTYVQSPKVICVSEASLV